jgi:hypothetical protein
MGAGLLVSLMSPVVNAQDAFEQDLRSQPFVYGSVGAFPSGAGGGATFGFGVGMDFLVKKGLGLGGDLALFGNSTFGFGVASFIGSYHFVRSSSDIVPFVQAGIGTGGEIGENVAFASFGGGVNLWKIDGAAIRIEVMDRFPTSGGDHHVNLQLGLTF